MSNLGVYKMGKLLKVLLLSFSLTFSVNLLAAGGKVVDFLLSESGVLELLAKNGVEAKAAARVSKYVKNSFISLTSDGKVPNKKQLLEIINSLSGNSTDRAYRAKLLKILNSDADIAPKEDVVDAVNSLIYIANRYGVQNSTILACADCVSEALGRHGFKFTLEEMSNSSINQLLKNYVPRDPKQLQSFIQSKMRSVGAGDFRRVSTKMVAPSEERTLALFLALAENGSPASGNLRKLVDTILEVSKDSSGKVNLFDADINHRLWKIVDDNELSDEMMEKWVTHLRKVADEPDPSKRKEAFFKVLREKAGDNDFIHAQINDLQVKKCFFR